MVNLTNLSGLSTDLILEIICKLKQSDLKLLLTSKKIHFIFKQNKRWIIKNIVKSYNFIFTDLSNISLIKNKLDVPQMDIDLIYAAKNGNLEYVRFFIRNGADIHTEDNLPLRYAARFGNFRITRFLLDHGADIHAGDDDALKWAASCGHHATTKLLIDRGANDQHNINYSLKRAASGGHIEIVKLLLGRGAAIHNQNNISAWNIIHFNGDDALISAAQCGHLEIVKLLIKYGADVHSQNDYALACAMARGHTEVSQFLQNYHI